MKRLQNGFTLLELFITMTIVTIMISVTLSSLSSARRRSEVRSEADKVLAALREVQNYSLTGKGINGAKACDRFSVRLLGNDLAVYYYDSDYRHRYKQFKKRESVL